MQIVDVTVTYTEEECLKNNKFEELFHDTEKKDE